MHTSLPIVAAWVDAGVLSLAGLVNLVGLRAVRNVYAEWDIPETFYHSLGLIQILAAAFLVSPDMRVYGILIAAPILFGSVVMLLNHRHYAVAAPVALMMAGLVVATLAVSPVHAGFAASTVTSSVTETAVLHARSDGAY